MAVAGDGDQFPDSAAARGIALAMQNEVHGFAGLRPDECLVQIGPRTQGHVGQSVQRIQRGIRVQWSRAFRRGRCSWPGAGRSRIHRGFRP